MMIHGLVPVNKPRNISSHTVVKNIRKLFKVKKAGHFGTLDPLAEGLLLIGVGNATKFFDFYMKKKKLYSGQIKFGYATTTYDSEGTPTSGKKESHLSQIDLPGLLSRFTGKQLQTPPIYSAKKYKGKPLYQYARKNHELEVKPVYIEIFSLKGKICDEETLWFEALTSSGTYIRSLAHDIGQEVGVGAYLDKLKREGVGEFLLKDAFTLEELTHHVEASEISKVVIPIEALLPEFPKIIVNQGGRKGVLNGMPLLLEDILKIMTTERVASATQRDIGIEIQPGGEKTWSKNKILIHISTENTENFRIFDDEGKLLAIARKDEKFIRFKPYIVFPNKAY